MNRERATLDELLEFANKVREAGGGAVLHALMPAVPEDPKQCLIAKNLNFNCWVQHSSNHGGWAMFVEDKALAGRIADAIDEPYLHEYVTEDSTVGNGTIRLDAWAIKLPERIGLIAGDFDEVFMEVISVGLDADDWDRFDDYEREEYDNNLSQYILRSRPTLQSELEKLWPYIEQSVKEAHDLGYVTDEGKLVL